MVQPSVESKITQEEAVLYDRQIRLWGLEAQNRLKNANVLLIGMSSLGAEVAKNIMLAGLKSLALLDGQTVTEIDLHANFLFDPSSEKNKMNRALASVERCRQLNPLVNVVAISDDPWPKAQQLINENDYDLVCCVDQSEETCVLINDVCRAKNGAAILFCAGSVVGWFGYCFNDFNEKFEYADEDVKPAEVNCETNTAVTEDIDDAGDGSSGEPVRKKPKSAVSTLQDDGKVVVRKEMSFDDFGKVVQLLDATGAGDTKWRRLPDGFYIFQILAIFRARFKRLPSREHEAEDLKALETEKNNLISRLGLAKFSLPENFGRKLYEQVPAVCAIVGGVLAQEIIKGVSRKDEPINNMFFYNPFDSTGNVGRFPKKA